MFLLQIQRRPELHVPPPKPVILAVHTGHPWPWGATAAASAAACAGGARRTGVESSHLEQRRHEVRRSSPQGQHLDVHGLGGHVDGEDSVRRE